MLVVEEPVVCFSRSSTAANGTFEFRSIGAAICRRVFRPVALIREKRKITYGDTQTFNADKARERRGLGPRVPRINWRPDIIDRLLGRYSLVFLYAGFTEMKSSNQDGMVNINTNSKTKINTNIIVRSDILCTDARTVTF